MLNHKTKHKIKMLYSEKNKISVISEVLGIDCQEIEQFLQEEKLLPKRVKDTDKVEMNKMAKAGLSISSIARHFDVSYITANKYIDPAYKKICRRTTPEEREKMHQMLKEGSSIKEIVEATGFDTSTVYRVIKKRTE